MTAKVFDIQRGSFVDGDGIRTAIFFKGCNLSCKWCHNPEGIAERTQMLFSADKCASCQKCVLVCPNGALTMSSRLKDGEDVKFPEISEKICTLCGKCADFCPSGAREICGRDYTADELFEIIMLDKAYFDVSGGGVTASGGEPMLRSDFLCELFALCKQNGINTAVDTAGNVPWSSFEKILPYTDTFLYDIKCASPERHEKFTGVKNTLILENLKRLSDMGKDICIRIPIISGVNDDKEELEKIKTILAEISYSKIEPLPYHSMAEHKYASLGKTPSTFSEIPKEKFEQIKAFLKNK